MSSEQTANTLGASPAFAALRQLQLDPMRALRLEQHFQARRGGGQDAMEPACARNGRHVVLAQGGFPALPEKER